MVIKYDFVPSPFGEMVVGATPEGVCFLGFCDSAGREAVISDMKKRIPDGVFIQEKSPIFATIIDSFTASKPVATSIQGTDFQMSVWDELTKIPMGIVVSYGEIAARIGRPKAQRAVGTAVGQNPVSLLVPCHRVVRSDGSLGGYHWGVGVKKRILEFEQKNN